MMTKVLTDIDLSRVTGGTDSLSVPGSIRSIVEPKFPKKRDLIPKPRPVKPIPVAI